VPGKLRRRRRGGDGLSRETPEDSVLPLLEAACLEAGVPGALGLQRAVVAAGYWEASLLDQWALVSRVLAEQLEEAPDRLPPLLALASSPDARIRFFVPAALDRILGEQPEVVLPICRRMAADRDKRVAEAVQAFAVRPAAERLGPAVLEVLRPWTEDASPFVRRAAVEATRPRGVWVKHLRWAVEQPALLLPTLRRMRREEELYPANAVANCLNDISWTRPQLTKEVLQGWLEEEVPGPLLRHIAAKGLRTLTKAGDPQALRLLGFEALEVEAEARLAEPGPARPNKMLAFDLVVRNRGRAASAKLVYEIETPGKNPQRPRRKRYHGRPLRLPGGEELVVRSRERLFDTRAAPLIDGPCRIRFFLNGEPVAELPFVLERPA
jgi:3-methyladenine DNA glycosylase AlkC